MRCADDIQVGGRLRLFINRWEQITLDPFILQIINGSKIEFLADKLPTRQENPRLPYIRSKEETMAIQVEIEVLDG